MSSRVKFLLESCALLLGGSLILAMFLVLRIAQGPLKMDFIKPLLEQAVSARTGLSATVDHVRLVWQGSRTPIELELQQLLLERPDGSPAIQLDNAKLGFSSLALLKGEFRPIDLTIVHPRFDIIRNGDGTYDYGFHGGVTNRHESLFDLLNEIGNPQQKNVLFDWSHLEVTGGRLVLLDPAGKALAQLEPLGVELDRKAGRVTAVSSGMLAVQGSSAALSMDAEYDRAGELTLNGKIATGLKMSDLWQMDPSQVMLENLDIPVAGNIAAHINLNQISGDIDMEADLAQGRYVDATLFAQPVPVKDGHVEAKYYLAQQRLEIGGFKLDLDGPEISATAVAQVHGSNAQIQIDGTFDNFSVDRLNGLWPAGVASGAREWIATNMQGGTVQKGETHLVLAAPLDNPASISASVVDTRFAVENTSVHYFGELPDIDKVSGTVKLDASTATVDIAQGQSAGLTMQGGQAVFSGLDEANQSIRLDLTLDGAAARYLSILDSEPLHYARKLGIKPSSIGGTATTKLHFEMPLLKKLSVSDLKIGVGADLHDLSLPNVVGGRSISELNGSLALDPVHLNIDGTGELDGVSLTVDLTDNFQHQNGVDLDVLFHGDLSDDDRAKLGFKMPERIRGPIKASGEYKSSGNKAQLKATIDAVNADFEIGELGYEKKPGTPATAGFDVSMVGGQARTIEDIALNAADLAVSGTATLDNRNSLATIDLPHFKVGQTLASMKMATGRNHERNLAISGPQFDAGPLLHEHHPAEGEPTVKQDADRAAINISAKFDRVLTGADHKLDDFTGKLSLSGGTWTSANFTATAAGTPVMMTYLPDRQDPTAYDLNVSASSAGALLSSMDFIDTVREGNLTVTGRQAGPDASGHKPPLTAQFSLKAFRLTDTPILARLLNLLTPTGLSQSLAGSGIGFDLFSGDLEIDEQSIQIRNAKLAGSALGLTIEGEIDRKADTLNLQGTIVPIYGFNRLLSRIPLVGDVLTGGSGEGLFAAAYTVTGPVDDPRVSVNPLSIFTPGVLRDLLFERSLPEIPEP